MVHSAFYLTLPIRQPPGETLSLTLITVTVHKVNGNIKMEFSHVKAQPTDQKKTR